MRPYEELDDDRRSYFETLLENLAEEVESIQEDMDWERDQAIEVAVLRQVDEGGAVDRMSGQELMDLTQFLWGKMIHFEAEIGKDMEIKAKESVKWSAKSAAESLDPLSASNPGYGLLRNMTFHMLQIALRYEVDDGVEERSSPV